MEKRRTPEIIAGRCDINGGIVTASGDFTVFVPSAGQYTITFPSGFRLISFTANAWIAAAWYVVIVGWTDRSVIISPINQATGVGAAQQFSFTAVGIQQ